MWQEHRKNKHGKEFNAGQCIKKYYVFCTALFIVVFFAAVIRNGRSVYDRYVWRVDGTTAVTNGSQVMYMLTVIIVGLAMGATVMIGKAVGGGKLRDAAAAIGNTVTLFMGLSVVITAVRCVWQGRLCY